ncbi:MmcQ/YjbR family DNA-binding protein [Sedimenticola selenatireducens]|jgi:predicted DNA-binding protein (MmcQ/YjbR family)|uniref:MmcQ/YjbR family DNA-binding protein n=1 Tax=Sedimenticola selenatireducens TaxID=191960 RepID=A0A558DVQ6_9GAMM|nr:MmcQ/YjbR family DNA-binding protein [Sedimenticola selenatireducens]TVO77826.1 MmcQ/YjbR family DNA-binding protein [Sedimenticola selenatireducens]TVT65131.1 MAG: MmcQ/YjbR family DNA-binding protein [Sedimenticola selenatireducens]
MEKQAVETALSQFKGSKGSYPFGPDALVFKVMGKMFALVSQNEATSRVTLKCVPSEGEVLVSQFESVIPGYYMNKKHWITISLSGDLADELLVELLEKSYELVVSKLPKADKKQLNDEVDPAT